MVEADRADDGESELRATLRTLGGRDELNLAEFPLALLTDQVPRDTKTLIFQDQLFDPQSRGVVVRKVTVTGSDAYGLPTAVDDEIILALIQLTKYTNNFSERKVPFTRYALIDLLGWHGTGKDYKRIEESLNRWMGVTLYYENAWWNKRDQSWDSVKFHILDNVWLADPSRRRARKRSGQQDLALSTFTWNEVVFRSFQAENLKRLDLEIYFALKRPIAKRMFRFLDKRFYHRRRWEFDLNEFAFEHIGLSRNYNAGQVKRKLQPSIDELTAVGFLEPMGREERFPKKGRGWQIAVVRNVPQARPKAEEVGEADLARELVARGVTPRRAADLIERHPAERIRAKLETFDWLKGSKDRRVFRNAAGFLVKSIDEDYAPPPGFESQASREARLGEEAARRRRVEDAERRRQAEEEAEEQVIASFWDALDEAEQDQLRQEALAGADRWLKDCYRRNLDANPKLAESWLNTILWTHIRKRLDERAGAREPGAGDR
jgi:hypothetical protein